MVDVVFSNLQSQFLLMPRGPSFLEYVTFREAYEILRIETSGFSTINPERLWKALRLNSRVLLVIRTILGFSPPEWQELAASESNTEFVSNYARSLEGKIKNNPQFFSSGAGQSQLNIQRVSAMLNIASKVLLAPPPGQLDGVVHRLNKYDTRSGIDSIKASSEKGVPYSAVLYERFLGRPFASHRDSVSEIVGKVMEAAIKERLETARVPFREPLRAERFADFDQAPDFFIPDEIEPAVVIEAKITSDDGTARDKVSRILRLAEMRDRKARNGEPTWELIACIDGRGFGVRRQDMKDLLIATKGKLYTAETLDSMVQSTSLRKFVPKDYTIA